jgi:hypothetical protein
MRIFNKFRGTRGFLSTWERVIRFRDMISKKAQHKARVLTFWDKHGLEATIEAFEVKRRTLFNWKKQLEESRGKLEALNDKSRAPKKRRKRLWSTKVIEEIKRLRWKHPNLGKEKLYPLLKKCCNQHSLKSWTVVNFPRMRDIICACTSTIHELIFYSVQR